MRRHQVDYLFRRVPRDIEIGDIVYEHFCGGSIEWEIVKLTPETALGKTKKKDTRRFSKAQDLMCSCGSCRFKISVQFNSIVNISRKNKVKTVNFNSDVHFNYNLSEILCQKCETIYTLVELKKLNGVE